MKATGLDHVEVCWAQGLLDRIYTQEGLSKADYMDTWEPSPQVAVQKTLCDNKFLGACKGPDKSRYLIL